MDAAQLLDFSASGENSHIIRVSTFGLVAAGAAYAAFLSRGHGPRGKAAALCALVFLPRFGLMMFYLSKRAVPVWEGMATGLGMLVLQPAIVCSCERAPRRMDLLLPTAVTIYSIGSITNTLSELERKWWKDGLPTSISPTLYTEGFFAYARHINYGAEVLIFVGWTMLCWPRRLPLLVPLFFCLSFIFFYVPTQTVHLRQKYGPDACDRYELQTPYKLFPWIY